MLAPYPLSRAWAALLGLGLAAAPPAPETGDGDPVPILRDASDRSRIRAEAETFEALVQKTKPDAVWNGRDMLWVEADPGAGTRFVCDRAYVFHPPGAYRTWVLMEPGFRAGEDARRVMPLLASKRSSDSGPGDYAIAAAARPGGGTVYELGWQDGPMGSGNWFRRSRLFVLRDASGRWRVIGPGVDEPSGHGAGNNSSYGTTVERSVEWTGDAEAPVRIRFARRVWLTEVGEEPVGLPDIEILSELVLEGPLPAVLKPAGRDYVVVGENDTLDAVVRRLSVWESGWDARREDRDRRRAAISDAWKEALLQANPGLPSGAIPKGTRVSLPAHADRPPVLRGQAPARP